MYLDDVALDHRQERDRKDEKHLPRATTRPPIMMAGRRSQHQGERELGGLNRADPRLLAFLFSLPPPNNPLLVARQSLCKDLLSIHPAAPGPQGRPPFDPDRGSRRILTAAAADPWILAAAGSSLAS